MNEERLNDEGKKWNGRALSQFELDSSLDCVLFCVVFQLISL